MTSKWQPIATVPRDGTLILLSGGRSDQDKYVGKWMHFPIVTARWWDKWIVALADADGDIVAAEYEAPTHWMPLPEPPT